MLTYWLQLSHYALTNAIISVCLSYFLLLFFISCWYEFAVCLLHYYYFSMTMTMSLLIHQAYIGNTTEVIYNMHGQKSEQHAL